jgi:hypothetical protein
MPPKKRNAPSGRRASLSKLAGGGSGKRKVLFCGNDHISKVRRELCSVGLSLSDTSGRTQRDTLLRVLQYLGPRGLNTPEAVGLGFYRVATRAHELEAAGWLITSLRERIVGADGLAHHGMARYVLVGRADIDSPQGSLDLGVPA